MPLARTTPLLRTVARASFPLARAALPSRAAPYARVSLPPSPLPLPLPRALSTSVPRHDAPASEGEPQGLKLEPKLQLTFTCTVPDCNTRSTHEFTRRSYQKGIVLVQCPGCKNRHLIADNLGWFKDSHEPRTVEQMVAANGGRVVRGNKLLGDTDQGETIEITSDSHPDLPRSDIPPPRTDK